MESKNSKYALIGQICILKNWLFLQGKFNFDHPDAFDYELLHACLKDIKEGRPTKVSRPAVAPPPLHFGAVYFSKAKAHPNKL